MVNHVQRERTLKMSSRCFCCRYQIEGCEVVWAIKDGCITSTFVDAAAADFLLSRLNRDKEVSRGPLKREKYTHDIPQVFTHKGIIRFIFQLYIFGIVFTCYVILNPICDVS